MSSSGEMALVPIYGWRFTFPDGVVLASENLEGVFAARPADKIWLFDPGYLSTR
jgi:hypothetical protein